MMALFIFGGGEGILSRCCRTYRLAFARCRAYKTVHRTVLLNGWFDSPLYSLTKTQEAPLKNGTSCILVEARGVEPLSKNLFLTLSSGGVA